MNKEEKELIKKLIEKIELLEKRIGELENKPANHYHYHYETQPIQIPTYQPYTQPYIGTPTTIPNYSVTCTQATPSNCTILESIINCISI